MVKRNMRALIAAIAGVACLALTAREGQGVAAPPPWQRTETRADCSNFNVLRQPYFGDVHVHTKYSFDAVTGDIREDPRGAYSFAQGNPIDLPPYVGDVAQRHAQLDRPLDFTAVTDHSEFFGEVSLCLTPGSAAYNDPTCVSYRAVIPQLTQTLSPAIQQWGLQYLGLPPPRRFSFCGTDGTVCLDQASLIWQDVQSAAEQNYDRSASCVFTTFVAYEWSGAPYAQNLHRNVIFRNASVPALPTSAVEQSTPQGLWAALKTQCLDAGIGCDVLAIPHNSNLSNGQMFAAEDAKRNPLISASEAAFRASMEPEVEVIQTKGDSECNQGVARLTNDELCGFEKWSSVLVGVSAGNPATEPLLYVRNALKLGLYLDQRLGVNPFQFGLIGSTDTHNATPGNTREDQYVGHLGTRDATPVNMMASLGTGVIGGVESNPGGLAVVWAEENSRDALFAAMRRRETYSTSGTRPLVRFFGGNLSAEMNCSNTSVPTDFVERGYQTGVPMGGEFGALGAKPTFAVLAMKDSGGVGTPLQRIQIVKGWLYNGRVQREHVYDVATAVAGSPDDGSTVDTTSCIPVSNGADTLCAVWQDKHFNPAQRAFYYARVVEDPVCRWSTRLCNAQGVDCSTAPPAGFEACCTATCAGGNNAGKSCTKAADCPSGRCIPAPAKTIQQRSLTSPIWYRPQAIGQLAAQIQYGAIAGTDVLTLNGKIRSVPASVDPKTQDLTLSLQDNSTIWIVTIPAGTLTPPKTARGNFTYKGSGTLGGILSLSFNTRTGALSAQTVPMDLSHADRVDHFVEFKLSIGTYTASYSRLWKYTTTNSGSSSLGTG